MYFPTIILDNFYDNLDQVITFAKSLDYGIDEGYGTPGVKSKPLHQVDYAFFLESTHKVMSLIYGDHHLSGVNFSCVSRFENIVPYGEHYDANGWVHFDDENMLTGILYLEVEQDHGTTLYDRKYISSKKEYGKLPYHYKESLHRWETPDVDVYNNELNSWNSNFEESVVVKGKPNRLVMFDSKQYHASNGYGRKETPRLIQTFFFRKIDAKYFPVPEMKRTKF